MVSPDRDPTLARVIERVAENAARIDGIEHEMERTRDALHEVRGQASGVTYIGKQVADLARNVERLAAELHTLGRRAVERPTPAGWSALAGWLSVLVAASALLVALLR